MAERMDEAMKPGRRPLPPLPPLPDDTVKEHERDWVKIVIKLFSFAGFSFSSLLSFNMLHEWFLLKGNGPIVSTLFAGVLVGTILVAPQMVIALLKKGGWNILAACIIVAVCSPAYVFSIMGNVGVQYERQTAKEKENLANGIAASEYERELKSASDTVLRRSADLTLARNEVVRISQEEFGIYQKRHDDKLSAARVYADKCETLLQNAESEVKKIQTAANSTGTIDDNRVSYYSWLGGSNEKVEKKIEFLFSFFPAMFLDIIAPTMLSVALYL